MHGDHLAAHDLLGDFPSLVLGITGSCPALNFLRNQTLLHLPTEEALAGVARPERAVTVEGSDRGFENEDAFDEAGLGACELGHESPATIGMEKSCFDLTASTGLQNLRGNCGVLFGCVDVQDGERVIDRDILDSLLVGVLDVARIGIVRRPEESLDHLTCH